MIEIDEEARTRLIEHLERRVANLQRDKDLLYNRLKEIEYPPPTKISRVLLWEGAHPYTHLVIKQVRETKDGLTVIVSKGEKA